MNWLPWDQALGLIELPPGFGVQPMRRDHIDTAIAALRRWYPDITFGDFLEGVALPFLRPKWKGSTRDTTENRVRYHLLREFGQEKLAGLALKRLQAFLSLKAETLSKSVVAHLRWDLRAIFRLAVAEGYAQRDPMNEYKKEAFEMFEDLLTRLREQITTLLSHIEIRQQEPALAPAPQAEPARAQAMANGGGSETNRNAPCPCGSGKKYKHCHGKLS